MTEETPPAPAARQPAPPSGAAPPRRLWLTIGEVVAVAGLGLAALNYWENHHDREQAAVEARQRQAAARASVFVMRGAADAEGTKVMLEPLKPEQAIQGQRYYFPTPVLAHAREIQAGRPQIDLVWFDDGLKQALKTARKTGRPYPKGEAELPVAIVTSYVEDGEMRTDRSLYRIGYTAKGGLLGALKLHLLGVSLVRRQVGEDVQAAVDAAWKAQE
jgi:hypothetical protein